LAGSPFYQFPAVSASGGILK